MSSLIVSAADKKKPQPSRATTDNPLLSESTLPFHMPPFDLIKDEHYGPAFARGFTEHLREVEDIAGSAEEPTFENTIVALERSGRTLERVNRIFSNLVGADTNPQLQKLETEMAPKLSAHLDTIRLDPKLFARLQALYDQREQLGLDPEAGWLLERYYKDFVRAGAKLSEERQGKAQGDELKAGHSPDPFRPECPEGEERPLDRGRQEGRPGRSARE